MDKERAFEVLKRLSFVRESATMRELEAARLIQEECEKMGVESVIESFDVPYPTIQEASLKVVSPKEKTYLCSGHGFSGQTDENGITAPLVYIHGAQDEFLQDVKGKIVLSTGGMKQETRKKLVEKGAVGYIVTWGGFYDDPFMRKEIPHRKATLPKDDQANFPGVMMNLADAELLVQSHPEEVNLVVRQDMTTVRESRNVVATIPGTDKEEEIVVFSAHYDSVEFSNGAWDNATGSVTLLELCHYFQEHKPRRTLKFVWCGSEEIDLNGSYQFCEQHKDLVEKIILDINFDMTGILFGEDSVFGSVDPSIVQRCMYLAKVKGHYLAGGNIGMPSTDATSFALHGIPAISFGNRPVRGGASIHSRRDVLDHLDPDAFISLCEFAATFSEEIINAQVNVVPRELPKEVTDKTDYWMKDLGLA